MVAFGAYTSGNVHREQVLYITSDGVERQEVAARRSFSDKRQVRPAMEMTGFPCTSLESGCSALCEFKPFVTATLISLPMLSC